MRQKESEKRRTMTKKNMQGKLAEKRRENIKELKTND